MMRWRGRAVLLGCAMVIASCARAQSDRLSAPPNLAPNSQWEIWSGVLHGTAQNVEGTGTVAPIRASANTTGVRGTTRFTVTTTDALRIGDLVAVSGSGVDASLTISPMRVIDLARNSSITVRTPFGGTPRTSHAATILPIVVGNLSSVGTGDAADGWKKTTTLRAWRETNPANIPPGAYYSMGIHKDRSGDETLLTAFDPTLYQGRTVVFGIYVNHKVRRSSGSWSTFVNTNGAGGSSRGCDPMPVSAGWQWQECAFTVPNDAKSLEVGLTFRGGAGDTYYVANPVFTVGSAIGGVKNYTKPQEMFDPVVHISPIGWIDATLTFPADNTGLQTFTMDPYAETGGQIAPTVTHAWGQLEGINAGDVRSGGNVRVMAWYDRPRAPGRSGSFLPQYVAAVKSFSYMDFPMNTFDRVAPPGGGINPLLGTGVFQSTVGGDRWSNVSLEFDSFLLK